MCENCRFSRPKKCAACGSTDDVKTCAGCKWDHYCSEECQKSAWKSHKRFCKIVQTSVRRSTILERYDFVDDDDYIAMPREARLTCSGLVLHRYELFEKHVIEGFICKNDNQILLILMAVLDDMAHKCIRAVGKWREEVLCDRSLTTIYTSTSEEMVEAREYIENGFDWRFHEFRFYDEPWLTFWHVYGDEENLYPLLADIFRLCLNTGYISDAARTAAFEGFVSVAFEQGLLPPWWSKEESDLCVQQVSDRDMLHNIHVRASVPELQKKYGIEYIALQMQLFVSMVQVETPGKSNAWHDGRAAPRLQRMIEAVIFSMR